MEQTSLIPMPFLLIIVIVLLVAVVFLIIRTASLGKRLHSLTQAFINERHKVAQIVRYLNEEAEELEDLPSRAANPPLRQAGQSPQMAGGSRDARQGSPSQFPSSAPAQARPQRDQAAFAPQGQYRVDRGGQASSRMQADQPQIDRSNRRLATMYPAAGNSAVRPVGGAGAPQQKGTRNAYHEEREKRNKRGLGRRNKPVIPFGVDRTGEQRAARAAAAMIDDAPALSMDLSEPAQIMRQQEMMRQGMPQQAQGGFRDGGAQRVQPEREPQRNPQRDPQRDPQAHMRAQQPSQILQQQTRMQPQRPDTQMRGQAFDQAAARPIRTQAQPQQQSQQAQQMQQARGAQNMQAGAQMRSQTPDRPNGEVQRGQFQSGGVQRSGVRQPDPQQMRASASEVQRRDMPTRDSRLQPSEGGRAERLGTDARQFDRSGEREAQRRVEEDPRVAREKAALSAAWMAEEERRVEQKQARQAAEAKRAERRDQDQMRRQAQSAVQERMRQTQAARGNNTLRFNS